ncbi:MAG: HEPN domain-containing protein [Pseudomonadota bacterium]
MTTITELITLARARLKDAQILFAAKRYDAATYLCGYAIELALKARICQTLGWTCFPETNKEFIRLTCEIIEKSIKSKRFHKLYNINQNDFCDVYEKYFQNHRFLKVHDLKTLLKFSGVEEKVRLNFYTEWTLVSDEWSPENRYRKIGTETKLSAQAMLDAVEKLLTIIL